MRKHMSLRVAVMASAALAIAVAGSAIAAGGGPKATGGVKFITAEGGNGKANFNAQPTSTGAKGTVQVVITGVANVADFKGDVTCYSQTGQTARFSGRIVKGSALVSSGPQEGQPATGYRITVVDTGEPGNGNDQIRVQRTPDVPDCNADTDAPRDILTGNIQVHQP